VKIIYLAGINNSEPEHWRRLWYAKIGGVWVEHADWNHPKASEWVSDLVRAIDANPGPKVFLAHSLGCLLTAQWALNYHDHQLAGAFLVAAPDPSGQAFPKTAEGFSSPLLGRPPFPTWLLASQNDSYSTFEFSEKLAFHWNSRFIDVGEIGHINLKSNLGFWDEGWSYFQEFLKKNA
jgi:predicted alpha/beta hydrolase family esterase